MLIQYIRNKINGSSANTSNHWVQISAWDTNRSNQSLVDISSNRAYGKAVSGSTSENPSYPYSRITNGNINTSDYAASSSAGLQHVIINLGAIYDIDFIQIWHYYGDMRIYFQNSLEVSTDGITWIVIQNPTGNMIENSNGNTYTLKPADYDKLKITKKTQLNLVEAINKVESLRGFSTTSLTLSNKLEAAFIQNFYTSLNRFNLNWQYIVSGGNKTDDNQVEEIYNNIVKIQNNASCTSGCSYQCSTNCSTICHSGCGKNCGATCASGCGANCTSACGNSCSGNCGSNCSSTCAGNCTGGCVTGCNTTCSGLCIGTNGG